MCDLTEECKDYHGTKDCDDFDNISEGKPICFNPLTTDQTPRAEVTLDCGVILREPDCAAVDCQYNAEARCKARPFITVNSKGECLDYDVLTDEEIEMLTGKAR